MLQYLSIQTKFVSNNFGEGTIVVEKMYFVVFWNKYEQKLKNSNKTDDISQCGKAQKKIICLTLYLKNYRWFKCKSAIMKK